MFKAKLRAPTINKNIISRERLLQKLWHVPEHKLTIVTAPAGYGKTTAVLHWLAKCGLPAAWLSVDSNDNNPLVFWQYVCSALDSVVDGISEETEYVFSSQELMKAYIHINILIDRLVEVQSDFLLVLDDLHLITDHSIMEGLSYLIDYMPSKMHLVFISRTEPELDLARQKIKWQIQRLGEKDLRFGAEEIFSFYQARGITLEKDEEKKVLNYTEGWAAALVVVAMSLEDHSESHDAISDFKAASRDIGQYLTIEVLRAWSPEKRNFAMKTSILDTLSEDLCDAVTGDGNAHRMLKEIYEGNGFLIAIDEQRQVYRYHHLFKSFLQKLLYDRMPEEVAGLHTKAGIWFNEQDQIPETIEHLLNAALYDEVLELIEHRVDYLIQKNDFGSLLSWIERLPEVYKAGNFKIATIYAVYYAEINRFDLSRKWVDKAKELVVKYQHVSSPKQNSYSQTVSTLAESNLLVREGKDGFLSLLISAAENNSDKSYRMPEYNDFNTADIYYYRCPINKAIKLFGETPEQYGKMTDSYRGMISKNPGYAPLGIGEYYYENNKLDEALPYLLDAMEEAQATGCPGALVPAMVDIARIKRAKYDMQSAFEVLDECEKKLKNIGKMHWIYLLHAFRCRLNIDAGAADKVEEWFASSKLNIFTEINKIKEFELIVYSRVLIFKGRLHDAKVLLQRLLVFAENMLRLHSRVEILNLLALLDYKNNDMPNSIGYLESSLAIGMEEGYIRSFMDEFALMANLLQYYTLCRKKWTDHPDTGTLTAFAKKLLPQMQGNMPVQLETNSDAFAELNKQLTEQEKKVLKLLFEANTNREIGIKLGVSQRTVKTHTGNIYSKLGVKTRAQCMKLIWDVGLPE